MSDRWTVSTCPRGHLTSDSGHRLRCPMCSEYRCEPFEVMRVPPPDADHDGLVSRKHGATSRNAALGVKPRSGTQRAHVLDLIVGASSHGLTRDEITFVSGMSPNTVRPRVKELLDGGHIYHPEGFVRKSTMGHDAEVLVSIEYRLATPKG